MYRDISINEDNLDWMEGQEEAHLPVHVEIQDDKESRKRKRTAEVNVRNKQDQQTERSYGLLARADQTEVPTTKNKKVIDALSESIEKRRLDEQKEKMATLPFPYIGTEAMNEYDPEECIFAKAFPWLFPGGLGDNNSYCDEERMSISDWAKKLLQYKDGRFAKDKIWCFFALNYNQRHKNQTQGSFFVKDFYNNGPETLEELQNEIENGSCKWIENITYFGGFVNGSPSYWQRRRDEIYSWINHHVAQGHGPPTAFMTLSCAEYYWPDVARLINERQALAGEEITDFSSPGASSAINDYTVVIQEYFQMRVKDWFETVGKNVFKIKHYWLRYEFAPGRGQIHAHCLLIMDNQDLQRLVHHTTNDEQKAGLVKDWAESTVGLTAAIPPHLDFDEPIENEEHPSRFYLTETEDLQLDAIKFAKTTQNHVCTDYCMRKRRKVLVYRFPSRNTII